MRIFKSKKGGYTLIDRVGAIEEVYLIRSDGTATEVATILHDIVMNGFIAGLEADGATEIKIEKRVKVKRGGGK